MEPIAGIEPATSALPRKCSTSELYGQQEKHEGQEHGKNWSGRRVSNPQPSAWKADALPVELHPLSNHFRTRLHGGEGQIRTAEV